MIKLVFLRHGQSVWNQARRFTGWADVDLSPHGLEQVSLAAQLLQAAGFSFDVGFTSYLQRSLHTLEIVLESMQLQVPVHTSWRLNERHYGALQGLSRQEIAERYGQEQVVIWQQHFDIAPPALDPADERFPGHDPRYTDLTHAELPRTETLKAVRARVLPYWHEAIIPQIKAGKQILIVAHGNSLRALTTYLDGIAEEDIPRVKRPLTGEPFVYEFDEQANPLRHYYVRRAPKLQRWVKTKLGNLGQSGRLGQPGKSGRPGQLPPATKDRSCVG